MKYSQIHKNEIVKIHNVLPESWNNISNLCALPERDLYDLSWSGNENCKFYPIEESEQPTYNPLYLVSGPDYSIDETNHNVFQSWVKSPVSTENAWQTIRSQRNKKLYATDWAMLPDSPLNEQQKNLAATYRQQLRDITEQSDPFNIVWPETIINP
jgi:hypothetical protein